MVRAFLIELIESRATADGICDGCVKDTADWFVISPFGQQFEGWCRLRRLPIGIGSRNLDPAVNALFAFLHDREIHHLPGRNVPDRAGEHNSSY